MLSGSFCSRHVAGNLNKASVQHFVTVQVQRSKADAISKELRFTGQTFPSSRVSLFAQTSGQVICLGADKGDVVNAGAVIAVLDLRDRKEHMTALEATLQQKRIEFEAAKQLLDKGLQSESQYVQALSALRTIEAQLKHAQLELQDTHILAPFSGILEDRQVEVGDYVHAGTTPVGTLIALAPLKVRGYVTERQVGLLTSGMLCALYGPLGETWSGTLSYVSRDGELASRTFLVEVSLENTEGSIPGGITVDARVDTQQVQAHKVNASLLSLNNDGILGVKTVDEDRRVCFFPVDWVRAEGEHIWIKGLPETTRIICVGQGFVEEGDTVIIKDVTPGDPVS